MPNLIKKSVTVSTLQEEKNLSVNIIIIIILFKSLIASYKIHSLISFLLFYPFKHIAKGFYQISRSDKFN